MREYFTEAIVLGSKPSGEYDRLTDLYTKSLGRLKARVVGGRRITSKLSPHLDKGNLVAVRLVEKNQFTVADAVVKNKFSSATFFRTIFLLKNLLPELSPDLQCWHYLVRSFKSPDISLKNILKILGYNPLLAVCGNCESQDVGYFVLGDQSFLCRVCFSKNRLDEKKVFPLN